MNLPKGKCLVRAKLEAFTFGMSCHAMDEVMRAHSAWLFLPAAACFQLAADPAAGKAATLRIFTYLLVSLSTSMLVLSTYLLVNLTSLLALLVICKDLPILNPDYVPWQQKTAYVDNAVAKL